MLSPSEVAEAIQRLQNCTPTLAEATRTTVERWLAHVGPRHVEHARPGLVNDPDVGIIELSPLEELLLGTPLLSRLRSFRSWAAAAYTFPGLNDTKLNYALAALGLVTRALKTVSSSDTDVPAPTDDDVVAVRLATLLKPIASGPFGQVLWTMVEEAHRSDFFSARASFATELGCVRRPTAEELCGAAMILSEPFVTLLARWFHDRERGERLAFAVAALQLGSGKGVSADYLADLVVGPISAPRLAEAVQLARGAGLSLAFDLERLLASLLAIKLSDEAEASLRGLARAETVLGIREGGVSSLEALAIGRTMLHSRIIDHPKTRVINRIATLLAVEAQFEHAKVYGASDIIGSRGDDVWLFDLNAPRNDRLSNRAQRLASRLVRRELPTTALAFGPAYLAGNDLLAPADAADQQAMVLRELQRAFVNPQRIRRLETLIARAARRERPSRTQSLDVIIDFPAANWSGAERVLVQTRTGQTTLASGHFQISGWNELYFSSKWAGRVYCDVEDLDVVERAARRVFAKEFGLVLKETPRSVDTAFRESKPRGTEFTPERADYFPPLAPRRRTRRGQESPYIRPDELKLPARWQTSSAALRERLALRLRVARPRGYSPAAKAVLIRLIDAITSFQAVVYEGGTLQALQTGEERRLQQLFRDHLRSRGFMIGEGVKLGGGEADLLFEEEAVIEIKIYRRPTDTPTRVGARFALQARRYALAIDKDIVATFVGYQPRSELGHHPASSLIDVVRMVDGKGIEVRAWVPIGFPLPSRARPASRASRNAPRTR